MSHQAVAWRAVSGVVRARARSCLTGFSIQGGAHISLKHIQRLPSAGACFDALTAVQAIEGGEFKKWIKKLGKEKGCKGKKLFMPVRIALTGQMAGPEVGELMNVLGLEDGECLVPGYTKLYERMDVLRACLADM